MPGAAGGSISSSSAWIHGTLIATRPIRAPWALRPETQAVFLNPQTHARSLTIQIGDALRDQDAATALMLADRRVRIAPVPSARDHLLHAEAARRVGDRTTAEAAIQRALEHDPTDVAVNLGVLTILGGRAARRAAEAIVATPNAEREACRAAMAVLVADGDEIIATLSARGSLIVGWVTWPTGTTLICQMTDRQSDQSDKVTPEPDHPFSTTTRHAAAVAIARPDDVTTTVVFRRLDHASQALFRLPPLFPARRDPSDQSDSRLAGNALSVIVPVYQDYEATVACLDSLVAQRLPEIRWATIVVDDASPDPRITSDLQRRAASGEIQLLTHAVNLGFSAAVNAAADRAPTGDILLLNADTLLPPDALRRLVSAAQGDRIGTVMPLSNNGELASFPVPNVVNDLPDADELESWDRAAAAGAGGVIDIPNGVGFCLLIKRACWRDVDGLSHVFGRGYHEDVDLCLRARDLGYRNVCATNVVVGHAGSRSFGPEKRALVVRNRAILDLRHPRYGADYAAFLHAAPLSEALGRIERRLVPAAHPILLVTARPHNHPATLERQSELASAGLDHLVASATGSRLQLRSGKPRPPQSLSFELAQPEDRAAAIGYLVEARIDRVEILEPDLCPDAVLATVAALNQPGDLHLDGLLAMRAIVDRPALGACIGPSGRILCRDGMALAAVAAQVPADRLVAPASRAPVRGEVAPASAPILAILSPVACASAWRLIAALADRAAAALSIRVLGSTLDDLGLMARGPVFVSGAIAPADLSTAVSSLAPTGFLLPYRNGQFRSFESACASGIGCGAYFDWSGGRYARRPGDLALDPGLCDDAAITHILDWFATVRAQSTATTP